MSLKHIKKLEQGKQGITGLVSIDDEVYVYKLSQYMNYLTNHEYLIMKGLMDLHDVCPHFCAVLPLRKYPIHPNFIEFDQDPFEECEKPLFLEVLLMEYVVDSMPLYDLIRETTIPMATIMGIAKQVMMAVIIAQTEKKYVHYDLHSLNILMKDVRMDDVYLYVLDDDNVFCVPTYGYNPVIIDHGFSYSKDLDNNPAYISLAYTDNGYMSPGHDFLADAKIFLISLSEDFKECRKSYSGTHKFRNVVKQLFKDIPVKWRSGWDIAKEPSIIDQIFEYIEDINENSFLFDKFGTICMDILQSLIILPYSPRFQGSLRELRNAYKLFIREFAHIEYEINNPLYSLYTLRNIIDTARPLKDAYMDESTRRQAVTYFENQILYEVNTVVRFCRLREVDFEKLLCSMFAFGEQLEFQLYHLLNKHMKSKLTKYKAMDVQCIEHMYAILDMNFADTYKFNNRTTVYVLNYKDKTRGVLDFSDVDDDILSALNKTPHYSQGMMLYSLYQDEEGGGSDDLSNSENDCIKQDDLSNSDDCDDCIKQDDVISSDDCSSKQDAAISSDDCSHQEYISDDCGQQEYD